MSTPAESPLALLRLQRRNLAAYGTAQPPDEAQARVAEAPIDVEALPEAVRRLVAEYEAAHPGSRLAVRRYVCLDGGEPDVRGRPDLPDEPDTVLLTVTETILTANESTVRSHVVVAEQVGEA
jgi:hypothetical protein